MSIPKIIHQIWIGPKKRPAKWMNTWKDMNPEWEYRVWDDKAIKEFGLVNQKQYDSIEEWAGKADIARYEILYRFGGFFCDADSECILPLDEHFVDRDSFASFENESVRKGLVANGYIGASKDNELMKHLIDGISKKSVSRRETGQMAWQTVGPLFFTQTIIDHKYPIAIYPSWTFIPRHYSGIELTPTSQVYAKQHWGSTQELSDPEFYNKLK